MKILLEDIQGLLKAIVVGDVCFENEESVSLLVNALGDYCSTFTETELSDLRGSSCADDINEYMAFMFEDYEWFDVLMYRFDMENVVSVLLSKRSLELNYSAEDVRAFSSEYLSIWKSNVYEYLQKTLNDIES